jgi:hypothetical protein
MLTELTAELDVLLRVLTILSRTPVLRVRTTVYSYSFSGDHAQDETVRYETPTTQGQARIVPELLSADRLPVDALDRMERACTESPYRGAILTASSWLGGYFGRQFIEQKVASAFTALDTLVQASTKSTGPAPRWAPARSTA